MTACSESHATLVARFLGFVFRFRALIGLGIFLPLAWLVLASLAAAAGWPLLPHETNALVFRVVVAATVVSASIAPFVVRLLRSPNRPFAARSRFTTSSCSASATSSGSSASSAPGG